MIVLTYTWRSEGMQADGRRREREREREIRQEQMQTSVLGMLHGLFHSRAGNFHPTPVYRPPSGRYSTLLFCLIAFHINFASFPGRNVFIFLLFFFFLSPLK